MEDQDMAELSKGILLLAEPFMMDQNFKRTVILLCEHNKEGSFGFVLTKDAPLLLPDAMDGVEGFRAPLFIGGPVETDTLHFLHQLGNAIPGTEEVAPGLYWGGDFQVLKELIVKGEISIDEVRFFLGYSGWYPGQLKEEMNESSWITHQANSDYVFNTSGKNLWKQVLQEKGGDYSLMVNFPENPILN